MPYRPNGSLRMKHIAYSSKVKLSKNNIVLGEIVSDLHSLKGVKVYRTFIQRISKPTTTEDKCFEEFPNIAQK